MLTRKSLARTAAATAGLALVATGALAPASADQGKGADRGQSHAAQAKGGDKADRKAGKSAKAEKGQQTAAAAKAEKSDQSESKGRSADAPHGNAYGHDKDAKAEAKSEARADKSETRGQDAGEKSNNGLGDERGGGHTPVTVCHAIGNGGYIEITFDENALKNHLANHMQHKGHMDFELEEGETCDEADSENLVMPGDTKADGSDDSGDESTDTADVVGSDVTRNQETTLRETVTTQVAGVQAFRARTGTAVEAPAAAGDATVAGVEATAPAAVPAAGPVAGILPQTGAAPMALAAAAGLGLVGAGATMVARRRREV